MKIKIAVKNILIIIWKESVTNNNFIFCKPYNIEPKKSYIEKIIIEKIIIEKILSGIFKNSDNWWDNNKKMIKNTNREIDNNLLEFFIRE